MGWRQLKDALKPAWNIGLWFFPCSPFPRLFPRFGLAAFERIFVSSISFLIRQNRTRVKMYNYTSTRLNMDTLETAEANVQRSARKRTLLRGVLAYLLAVVPMFLIVSLLMIIFRTPIVYLFGLDNTPLGKKAWNQADWYLIPPAWFIAQFALGWIVAHWAPKKSRVIIWTYLAVMLPLAFNDPLPDANTPIKLAIWGLSGALGLVLGNESYHWNERRSD